MSPSEKTAEDVSPSEGSLTIFVIPPEAHEPQAGVQARSTFVYPDDITPEVCTERKASVILPEKSKEEDLAMFPKATCSLDDLSNQKNENHSNPLDEMAVMDFEIREDGSQRTITFRSILVGILVSILGAAIAEASNKFPAFNI